jgi:hypothetical protein
MIPCGGWFAIWDVKKYGCTGGIAYCIKGKHHG